MSFQLTPSRAAAPQSQMLAQALAAMKAGQPVTPIGLTANLAADALNTFGAQAAGQGGADQWRDPVTGAPSGNWFNSPLGQKLGALFGLGQAAGPQGQIGYGSGPSGVSPDDYIGAWAAGAPPQ